MAPDSLWYFAFGANMNSKIFRVRRGMHPTSVEPAQLHGYKLVFDHPGLPVVEPAFANVEEDANSTIHGVLYHMTRNEMALLNKMEGGGAYKNLELEVIGAKSGPQTAHVFWSPNTGITHLNPSRRYMQVLIEGAREQGLPDTWIAHLVLTPTSRHYPVLSPGMKFVMPLLNQLFKRGLATPFLGWKEKQHQKARVYNAK
jgi:gamma-glutamylcyclotransferase